jgi:hypothetical protein
MCGAADVGLQCIHACPFFDDDKRVRPVLRLKLRTIVDIDRRTILEAAILRLYSRHVFTARLQYRIAHAWFCGDYGDDMNHA